MEYAVSVIIPVYNVEKTLRRCVESVLAQTFKNFEIILVDDGSPDNSGKICDEYAQKYNFIKVIHKENEGLGPTRNRGVKEANGIYVYHCDSDDWIKETTLEDAYNAAIKNDADVVLFGYTLYTEKDDTIKKYETVNVSEDVYKNNLDIRKFFLKNVDNYFIVQSACNRLVKKKFLIENDIWFQPFRRCQDIVFSYDLFEKIDCLVTLDRAYYEYIIEPNVYKGRSFDEMIEIYLSVYDIVKTKLCSWNEFFGGVKNKITSIYCAHIANYLSFFFFRKGKVDKTISLKKVLKNEKIIQLFSELNLSETKSKFLRMIAYAIKMKSCVFLYIVLLWHNFKLKK